MDQLQQLPFQVQVTYTSADGSKAMRVLTQLKEKTDNREVAEVNAVRSVIAENHIRSTANDMMVAVSDEDDDYYTASSRLTRTRYATPVVQKQRLAYMDNLNTKVRSRDQTDQFNERFAKKIIDLLLNFICFFYRRWNKASNELQTHVVSSRARKAITPRSVVPSVLPPPPPSSSTEEKSSGGSVFNKVARFFTGSTKETSAEPKTVAFSTTTAENAKRSYGFATSNLSLFSDQHSENLYRYKNISSDYMREESPPRQDDNTERRPPSARRQNVENNNETLASVTYPTRAAVREARRAEIPRALPDTTGHFEPKIESKPADRSENAEQDESKPSADNDHSESERL